MMKLTPRELELAHKGYRTRKDEDWEIARWMSFYSVSIHAKPGFDISKIKLPIDHYKKRKKKKLTPDMMMKVTKIDG